MINLFLAGIIYFHQELKLDLIKSNKIFLQINMTNIKNGTY